MYEIERAREENQNKNRQRKRDGKDKEIEGALREWFSSVREKDVRVSGPLLQQKVEELGKKMGKEGFVVTNGWLYRWRKRVNLEYRKPHGEAGEADHSAAHQWLLEEWPKLVAEYPPSDIYNADETGLYYPNVWTTNRTGNQ